MKVQAIATSFIVYNDERTSIEKRYRRGDVFELDSKRAKAGIEAGLIREHSDDAGELPPPNWKAADPRPTQPDGTPISEDSEGTPLVEGAILPGSDWKAPATHKDADAQGAELGIAFPKGAKLVEKANAIRDFRAAQAAGESTAPTSEELHELGDEELIQRGIDFGLTEDELVEKDHDGLVLAVAEAMNRQTDDPAAQASRTAELAARREADED